MNNVGMKYYIIRVINTDLKLKYNRFNLILVINKEYIYIYLN